MNGEGQYLPLIPDDEGRVLCQTVGVWMGLEEGKVVMVDATTGERLLASWELQAQLLQTEQQLLQTEQRAAKLAELLQSQGLDLNQI